MHIKLIANPAAGRGGKRVIERVCAYLTERGNTVDTFLTGKRGDALKAAREAREGRVNLIIAAGGDGTINEVVNGLAGSSIPLGVLPLGTVNVFALETGIPMDPMKACEVVLNGTPKRISLAKVNDHYFLLMAGIGFDAHVVYGLDLRLKRLSGRLSYIISGIGNMFSYSGQHLQIELDNGERLEGYGAVVGNGKYYGGKMSITPFADLERGDLDICIFEGKRPIDILRYTWGVLRKRHLSYPDVQYRTAKGLKVTSSGKNYIQADGDIVGSLPAVFTVVKDGLMVILPERGAPKP